MNPSTNHPQVFNTGQNARNSERLRTLAGCDDRRMAQEQQIALTKQTLFSYKKLYEEGFAVLPTDPETALYHSEEIFYGLRGIAETDLPDLLDKEYLLRLDRKNQMLRLHAYQDLPLRHAQLVRAHAWRALTLPFLENYATWFDIHETMRAGALFFIPRRLTGVKCMLWWMGMTILGSALTALGNPFGHACLLLVPLPLLLIIARRGITSHCDRKAKTIGCRVSRGAIPADTLAMIAEQKARILNQGYQPQGKTSRAMRKEIAALKLEIEKILAELDGGSAIPETIHLTELDAHQSGATQQQDVPIKLLKSSNF
jgi:hypothetical protein